MLKHLPAETVSNSGHETCPPMLTEWVIDGYQASAGRELDAYIHHRVLRQALSNNYPRYSTDIAAAQQLRLELQSGFGIRVIVGPTSLAAKPWFARYEVDRGNPTEVLAETLPLAICRLAVLRSQHV